MLIIEKDVIYNSEAWKAERRADPGFLEKGVNMYKGVGVPFAEFISIFLHIP